MPFTNQRHLAIREIFRDQRLPLVFVDLDVFDANVVDVADKARGARKTVRLGSKSIRCEPLMRRILAREDVYRGFLTYTVEETKFLAERGK
ncbi:MAG: hypothetical protein Fur0043_17520 [Anaerolineales bacterium]